MKNKLRLLIVVLVALQLTGCETIPKKFIRKKPKPAYTPSVVYTDQGPYQKQFSNEYYYKTHFTLWKSAQDDAMDSAVGGNSKRLRRSLEEAVSHLDQMSHYLKPEKAAELAPRVEELQKNMALLRSLALSKSREVEMRADLERMKRVVSGDFYYDKVREDVLPDDVHLGDGEPGV